MTKTEWMDRYQDGLLEADEEEPENEEVLDYTNDATHWDEYMADLRYDMYRDLALMGYEY